MTGPAGAAAPAELPALGGGTRFLLGLFAAMPATLVVGIVLHLAPPPGWTPLAQRPAWAMWTLVALWPAIAAGLAFAARRESPLWRWTFGLTAGLLVIAAFLGGWHGHPPLGPMTVSLLALAGGSGALAFTLGEPRPDKRPAARRAAVTSTSTSTSTVTSTSTATAAPTSATGRAPASGLSIESGAPAPPVADSPSRPAPWRRVIDHLARYAGFWITALLMVESFRLAHLVAVDPQRGVGMLGMLLTFFLVLPAVSLAAWLRRTAIVLLALAALAFAALAGVSGVPQAGVAAALLTWPLARAWRQAPIATDNAADIDEVPA
ncbi:hypothetical protein [Mitsuaria sp. GD03876]|uniref:hypothetical protein n=1 Tax=Mitsuaria sp. GD03876 TaxID=2975399 RepID=UPI00244B0378|nr:hypothetical protein [Mitsuaria sp. GD03876]MDH0865863.1 hypothetical protein [Mitsuaria sp. GD03876]